MHLRRVSDLDDSLMFICTYRCQKSYLYQSSLKKHYMVCHKDLYEKVINEKQSKCLSFSAYSIYYSRVMWLHSQRKKCRRRPALGYRLKPRPDNYRYQQSYLKRYLTQPERFYCRKERKAQELIQRQ